MLITLLIAILVIGLIYYLITMLPLPTPFKTAALFVMVVICIIWLLEYLPGHAGGFGHLCGP